MYKFSELNYARPDYKKEQKILLKYREEIASATSYEEVRHLWFSMKGSMQYVDYLEEYAYICYLCGISNEFYKEEMRIQDIEYPKLSALQNECDRVFLDSRYIKEFGLEFGDKIINQLKNNTMFSNEQTIPFYYIEYDIAQISVFEFYGRSRDNYIHAWKDYSNLCHSGGSMNYLDLLNIGNLTNPFSGDAVAKICKPVLDELFSLT